MNSRDHSAISAAEDPVEALIKSIRIPPRPTLLTDLQQELANAEPDPYRIAQVIGSDAGMSGALLKLANSSFFGLRRKVVSVEQGIAFLGINQCAAMATGVLARQAVGGGNTAELERFWDMSMRRAKALVFLAGRTRICRTDIAHTFGLFCDIGVPLLMDRFPDYVRTYADASGDLANRFTAVEDARHSTNHAAIGCLLTRNWGLPDQVSHAVLHHHDYGVFEHPGTDDDVRSLIALFLLAEGVLDRLRGHLVAPEWEKGGKAASRHLGLTDHEVHDLLEELHEQFDSEA